MCAAGVHTDTIAAAIKLAVRPSNPPEPPHAAEAAATPAPAVAAAVAATAAATALDGATEWMAFARAAGKGLLEARMPPPPVPSQGLEP